MTVDDLRKMIEEAESSMRKQEVLMGFTIEEYDFIEDYVAKTGAKNAKQAIMDALRSK